MRSFVISIARSMAVVIVLMFGAAPSGAKAETIRVPAEHTTIQGAIEAARDGDTIIVSPGTYRENINFLGKVITVRSTNPDDPDTVEATVIEAGPGQAAVTFSGGEDRDSVLIGLSIAGADATTAISGGGIYCLDSSPTVSRCTILGRSSRTGIRCVGGAPIFTGCTIELPMPNVHQRVAYCADSAATFRECTIVRSGFAGQTYDLNGTPTVGPVTIVEFNPNMTSGAVYVVEGTRTIKTRSLPNYMEAIPAWCGTRRPTNDSWAAAERRRRAAATDWTMRDPVLFHAPYLRSRGGCAGSSSRPWITGRTAWDPALFYAPYLRSQGGARGCSARVSPKKTLELAHAAGAPGDPAGTAEPAVAMPRVLRWTASRVVSRPFQGKHRSNSNGGS